MANASDYIIAGNDEHGIDPPTAGKRTPTMPYIDRSFYENEFNFPTKNSFLAGAARIGFGTYDVKPEYQDVDISSRVLRVNLSDTSLVVTFAYNATVNEEFNSWGGLEVFYSLSNRYASYSKLMSDDMYSRLSENGYVRGNGVLTLTNIGMLESVDRPASLIEGGFMTNFDEAKLMVDPDYQDLIGKLALEGICQYLGVTFVEPLNSTYTTLAFGATGNMVKYLQYTMRNYGYTILPDGIFGNQTDIAVRAFQARNSLTVDGIVGNNTWSKVNNFTPQYFYLRNGSRGTEVLYLQKKLLSKLYVVGDLDGDFGAITQAAVIAFQQENSLSADGIVGPLTWEKLRVIGGGRPLI